MTSYDPESWKLLRIIITVSKHRFQMTSKIFPPNYSSQPQPALRTIDWSSFAKRNTTIDETTPWRNFSQITPSPRAKVFFSLSWQTHAKATEPSTAELFQSILPSLNSSPWAIAPAISHWDIFLLFIKLKACWNISSASCWNSLKVPDNLSFARWCDISFQNNFRAKMLGQRSTIETITFAFRISRILRKIYYTQPSKVRLASARQNKQNEDLSII